MTSILIPNEKDPIKQGKDCPDWCPLRDGTKTGDPIYCDLSTVCQQTDEKGRGFISHWYKFRNEETGEEAFDYFCTGIYPESYDEYKGVDEEVS
jgi:hypothetical protein